MIFMRYLLLTALVLVAALYFLPAALEKKTGPTATPTPTPNKNTLEPPSPVVENSRTEGPEKVLTGKAHTMGVGQAIVQRMDPAPVTFIESNGDYTFQVRASDYPKLADFLKAYLPSAEVIRNPERAPAARRAPMRGIRVFVYETKG